MIVDPYRLRPVPPLVALLDDAGRAISEEGELLNFDAWPKGVRLWASYDTVYRLVREGKGEALCWRNEEIRWRHAALDRDEWQRRASDANVLRLPLDRWPFETQLAALCAWRDWLGHYGAAPTGTSGSAAWSLLRARLERRLVTNAGERPPIGWTAGGRQELGPAGPGRFDGALHLDLPAAYASTLAGLRYGGLWLEASDARGRELERYGGGEYPVFVRARVRVPGLSYGPLLKRPRSAPRGYLDSSLRGSWYPRGARVQGVWTWEEVAAAEAAGCRVEKVLGGWIHRSGWFPFAPWWEAIEAGRAMPGLAGLLAKVTGNALWGRFCLDPRLGGRRTIRSSNGKRLRDRPLVSRPAPWPAHDLAETVSGRVRAQLFTLMMEVGDGLLCAHTDGAWVMDDRLASTNRQSARSSGGVCRSASQSASRMARMARVESLDHREMVGVRAARDRAGSVENQWRLKESAGRLDLIHPQRLRYWLDRDAEPRYVVSGVPALLAAESFERDWQRAGFAA